MQEKLLGFINSKSEYLRVKVISLNDAVLKERIRLQCFHYERYNNKRIYPPKIEKFDFKKSFTEYLNVMTVCCERPCLNHI